REKKSCASTESPLPGGTSPSQPMQKCEEQSDPCHRQPGQSIRLLLRCRPEATTNVRMRPVLLVVLDGWGNSASREGNAILLQGTPNLDELPTQFPVSQLHPGGLAAGLP